MAQAPVSVAKLLEGLTRPFVVGTAVSAFPLGRTIAQVYACNPESSSNCSSFKLAQETSYF
ncbi:hypothetical protein PSTT_15721 [Puccinia striiformis]|uniref:Uncharacterized protein n=1 Tax=Puccinia striiformis TaxID=27350 RepID=A0A2S4UG79_9BASI|nr:hypothetical protein PSTT_15721 [Puccinia striiformis]